MVLDYWAMNEEDLYIECLNFIKSRSQEQSIVYNK